ncbi:hypothetical protein CR513_43043, partial [Mucuna pruriens]
MVRQYEYGFNHALAQARIIYPDLDLSGTDPYKEIVDGRIVDIGQLAVLASRPVWPFLHHSSFGRILNAFSESRPWTSLTTDRFRAF